MPYYLIISAQKLIKTKIYFRISLKHKINSNNCQSIYISLCYIGKMRKPFLIPPLKKNYFFGFLYHPPHRRGINSSVAFIHLADIAYSALQGS